MEQDSGVGTSILSEKFKLLKLAYVYTEIS